MNTVKKPLFRKVTKRFVVICNIILALVFLIASLANYLNPVKFWYIAFLGLLFPYLILLVLFFIFFWIFFKSKWVFLNLLILAIGWQSIQSVVAMHPFSKKFSITKKDTAAIRILQWNTMSFGEYEKNRVQGSEIREKMLQYIKEQDADILCLQEFFDAYDKDFNQNIKAISEDLAYPYYYYTKDYERYKWSKEKGYEKIGYWGNIIFSKLSIADSGKITMEKDQDGNSESLNFVDINVYNNKMRVMTTHLQSIKLGRKDYQNIYKIKTGSETDIKASKNIFSKIKRAYKYRKQQTDLIHNEIINSPYPVLITGDFNDVPNSYTYTYIKGNLQDVFLKKGFGVGRTFSAISPTLRIDYILADKKFKVIQVKKESIPLSDHYPIVCDLKLN